MENKIDNHPASPPSLLTLAMIVKDAGQFLAPLLESAAPWVDEMVIADTGSCDDTREFVHDAGAILLEIPWENDFAAARNAVLDEVHGRWVFCLDADERLSQSDWRTLRDWVSRQDGLSPAAARIQTRNYLRGMYSRRGWRPVPKPDPHALAGDWPPAPGFTPTAKIRLFPSRGDIRFAGAVHETVEASVESAGLDIVNLDVPVHHFGTLNADAGKMEFYLRLARQKTAQEPRNAAGWAELADCAIQLGRLDEALAAIDRALILEPSHPDRRLTAGWLLLESGRMDQADAQLASVAGSGCADDGQLAEACHLRAQIAIRQGKHDVAGRLLAVALHLFPDNGHYHNTLGVWHLTAARGDRAQAALERACQLLPGVAEPWLNLGRLYASVGRSEVARHHLQQALALDPGCSKASAALAEMEIDTEAAV